MTAPRWWQIERMAIERMEDAILGYPPLKPEPAEEYVVVCDPASGCDAEGHEFCDNPACVPCNDRARWHHEDNMEVRHATDTDAPGR